MVGIKHKASWQLSAERQGLPAAEWTPLKELFPVLIHPHSQTTGARINSSILVAIYFQDVLEVVLHI